MDKLSVAIIGCGRIAQVYKQAFQELQDEVEVVCAVDQIQSRAEEFATDFRECRYSDQLEDLWQSSIDVLHICLPHDLHAPIAMAAMERGIHVLTEKPVALNVTEAEAMIACQARNQVLAGCIFQTRYVAAVERIRRAIDQGLLGNIIGVKSILTWSRQQEYYQGSDWKGTWDREGGGVLIDQAIHSIDRVRYILNDEVEWVEGNIATYYHDYLEVEDTASACIRFKRGAIYNLYATNIYYDNSPVTIEFVGTKGKAGLIQDFGYIEINGQREEIKESYKGNQVGPNYWGSSHEVQLEEFYAAVRLMRTDSTRKPVPITVDLMEAKQTLAIIRAIYQASDCQTRVVFPFQEK